MGTSYVVEVKKKSVIARVGLASRRVAFCKRDHVTIVPAPAS